MPKVDSPEVAAVEAEKERRRRMREQLAVQADSGLAFANAAPAQVSDLGTHLGTSSGAALPSSGDVDVVDVGFGNYQPLDEDSSMMDIDG